MRLLHSFSAVFLGTVLLAAGSGSGTDSTRDSDDYRCPTSLDHAVTSKAAALYGAINNASFVGTADAVVTVQVYQADTNRYEKIVTLDVPKSLSGRHTEFNICRLTPGEGYRVVVSDIDVPFTVGSLSLNAGQVFSLNGGHPF